MTHPGRRSAIEAKAKACLVVNKIGPASLLLCPDTIQNVFSVLSESLLPKTGNFWRSAGSLESWWDTCPGTAAELPNAILDTSGQRQGTYIVLPMALLSLQLP